MTKKKDNGSLCFRCNHRAEFLESGNKPRFECGQVNESKLGCYCYVPVKPVILQRDKGDRRVMFGAWMMSARCHYVKTADKILTKVKKYYNGSMLYYVPEEEKK